MQLSQFTFGGARQGFWQEVIQPAASVRMNLLGSNSKFSTMSLLPPQQPTIIIHNSMGAAGLEQYKANESVLREQAIIRAATASFKIGKNADGSIWMEDHRPEAALARMRATGGETEIDWFKLNMDYDARAGAGTGNLDEVALRIDYYASEYAQYKTRIENQFTGEKQQAELAKLEQFFAKKVGSEAEYFSKQVGGFLANNGVPGEEEALRNSFLDVYEQRKSTYLLFIGNNSDYAGVHGTEDEWLLNAGEFMGEQLRYAMLSQEPEMNLDSRHGYSVDDLQAVGMMTKELSKASTLLKSQDRSEEELGIRLGMAAMKYTLLSSHFQLGEEIREKMDKAMKGFIQNEMDRVTAYIEQQRADPYVRNKQAYAIDFDQQAVLDIIKRMVDNLSEEDVDAAFRSDWSTMVSLYTSKFQDFSSSQLSRYHPYNSNSSWVNQNLAGDWNRFVQQLSGTTDNDLGRYLLKDQFQWMDIRA